ncbi:MAG: DUF2442 domain-containing protein [bacterium]
MEVRPRREYRIWVRFEDETSGEVDLSELAGKGVFAAWNKPGVFEQVAIDPQTHTVCWPGGIDLCPDRLYEDVRTTADALVARDRKPDTPG